MFENLNQYFPIVVFGVSGLCLFSRRPEEQAEFPLWLYVFLTLAFLQPWLCINYFRQSGFWLFSIQALTALMLMITRRTAVSDEAWLKASVSLLFGVLFLSISQYPSLGLPFAISSEWSTCLVMASTIVAVFLLFGLPPLQLGSVDIGSERSTKLHLHVSVLYRFVIGFYFVAHFQGSKWFDNIYEFQGLFIVFILFGLSLSHITLRLQTNLYRLLSYLGSSIALSLVFCLVFPEFGAASLMIIILSFLPFLVLLNPRPVESGDGLDLWNVTQFYRCHPTSAKHFFLWLKIVLIAEGIVSLALLAQLARQGRYFEAAFALLFAISILSVVGDKQAFVPRSDL